VPLSSIHSNVLRFSIRSGIIDRIISSVHRRLPGLIQGWLEARLPEWFLSLNLILKKQKSGWDEKFEREKYTLNVMKPVQGRHFAICYGEVDYGGTRALLLSEVGGHALNASNATEIDADALRRMLHEAIRNANE
jgi:hypothetical protein